MRNNKDATTQPVSFFTSVLFEISNMPWIKLNVVRFKRIHAQREIDRCKEIDSGNAIRMNQMIAKRTLNFHMNPEMSLFKSDESNSENKEQWAKDLQQFQKKGPTET